MRRVILTIGLAILLFCNIAFGAANWDIYNDAVIQDGDEYLNVGVYDTPPDHTTVDMTGGLIDTLFTYDESTFNISEGYISSFCAYNSSSVSATGGEVYGLYAYDTSVVIISNDMDVDIFRARGNSVATLQGGIFGLASVSESGKIDLYGGIVSDYLAAGDSGIINLYGYGLAKFYSGGQYDYGYVTGQWADGYAFEIDLSGSETYSRLFLHEIPEPGTGFLIALGAAVILRKHRRQIQEVPE